MARPGVDIELGVLRGRRREASDARKALFDLFDTDGDGAVSRQEWEDAFRSMDRDTDGVVARNEWLMDGGAMEVWDAIPHARDSTMTWQEWMDGFVQVDRDDSGAVSFKEWCASQKQRSRAQHAECKWTLASWLASFDVLDQLAAAISGHIQPEDGEDASSMELNFVRRLGEEADCDSIVGLLTDSGAVRALAQAMLQGAQKLAAAPAATGEELNEKFSLEEGTFELSYGSRSDFFSGLHGLLGPPSTKVEETMEHEHCCSADSDVEWTTGNYGITTTPKTEWLFVNDPAGGLAKAHRAGWPIETKNTAFARKPQSLSEFDTMLKEINGKLVELSEPPVQTAELVGGRLYTGPMFEKYNAACRGGAIDSMKTKQAPAMIRRFDALCMSNRYTETVFVINSCIIKLSKVCDATHVFRGMVGGRLPQQFWKAGRYGGPAGGVEFGFMSTTRKRAVAAQYSRGGAAGTVLEMATGMIDRGADFAWLSQYPHEQEILFPPLTGMEVVTTRVEGGTLILALRLSINLTAGTIDQVVCRRRTLIEDMGRNLEREMEQICMDGAQQSAAEGRDGSLSRAAQARAKEILKQRLQSLAGHPSAAFNGDEFLLKTVRDMLRAKRLSCETLIRRRFPVPRGQRFSGQAAWSLVAMMVMFLMVAAAMFNTTTGWYKHMPENSYDTAFAVVLTVGLCLGAAAALGAVEAAPSGVDPSAAHFAAVPVLLLILGIFLSLFQLSRRDTADEALEVTLVWASCVAPPAFFCSSPRGPAFCAHVPRVVSSLALGVLSSLAWLMVGSIISFISCHFDRGFSSCVDQDRAAPIPVSFAAAGFCYSAASAVLAGLLCRQAFLGR